MGKGEGFLTLGKLYNLCSDKGIIEDIRKTSSASKARQIIEKVLSNKQRVTDDIIRKLKKQIDKENSKEDGSTSNGEGNSGQSMEDAQPEIDSNTTDEDETKLVDNGNVQNGENSPQKQIKERTLEDEKDKVKSVETITTTSTAEKDAVLISTAEAERVEKLINRVTELEKENQNLKDNINELKLKLAKYTEKDDEKDLNNIKHKDKRVSEIARFLSVDNEMVTTIINKRSLDIASKILDKSLDIKFENMIEYGNDMYSYLNQLTVLEFINEKSF